MAAGSREPGPMSLNRQTEIAREYHARTAHTALSVRSGDHALDWDVKPAPFKLYPDVAARALPRDLPALTVDTFAAMAAPLGAAPAALDVDVLAALLFFSAGVTKHRRYPGGGEVFFRAAPSTGALYQTEVYVVAGEVAGLEPGVYHFGPGDLALRAIRAGDFRGVVAAAAADEALARAPAVLVLTAIYWRNTWKYRARGFRHLFWDAGTMLAQTLATAAALGPPVRLLTGFVEAEVNGLLGVDPGREGALALVAVGSEAAPAPPPPLVRPLAHAVAPLSAREVDYPLLREAYEASSLDSDAEVLDWRESAAGPDDDDGSEASAEAAPEPPTGGAAAPLPPPGDGARVALPAPAPAAGRGLGETIMVRASTRRFSGEAITLADLSAALWHATRPVPADVPLSLVDLYLTVHAVEGLAPGAYAYERQAHALVRLREGDVRAEAAYLCLEQPLGGLSSATVFFLADLGRVLGRLGNRGYRLANLEAGLAGGRLYLAAYARRFGASGLTFYDGDVVRFFSPHAAGRDALFVVALGRAARGGADAVVAAPRARRGI